VQRGLPIADSYCLVPELGAILRAGDSMEPWFLVEHLDVERLLSEWRWLCPRPMTLAARTAFGDLFLRDEAGAVFWLDIAVGKLTQVSNSEARFREMAETREKREEWFAESDMRAAEERGLKPGLSQCVGFKVPLAFAESGSPDTPYVADLHEYVSFLGDLNRQISSLPEGSKVRLRVVP
jgi:hypothetical protein